MPIYEYACSECGAAFERRIKYEERLNTQACPSCGRENVKIRMSAPSLIGGGSSSSVDMGVCPTSGAPCGCANAIRH